MTDNGDPPAELDAFFLAPDEVLGSSRERQLLVTRKKLDEARREQERSRKRKRKPSQEDILADMIRVAEDAEDNPFHEMRILSEKRYQVYGHYPLEEVLRHGQFEFLKQQANLARKVGDRTLLKARTVGSLNEHDQRYMERCLLPHLNKFPELTRKDNKWHAAAVISDVHSFALRPFTWDCFLDAALHVGADVLYLNGDMIDANEISTHPKVPGSRIPLQAEFDMIRGLIREIRNRFPPDTRVVWGAGNHGIDRLVRYLTQSSGLSSMRNIRIDQLMELDGLEVELAQGGSFLSPKGTEDQDPRTILWEVFMATHGTSTGKHPASQELQRWGMSGTSGHVHRSQIHYGATWKSRGLNWTSTPMACVEAVGRDYIKDFAGWQEGFGIFYVTPKGLVKPHVVLTDGGEAYHEGILWKDKKGSPTTMKQLKSYWAKRLGLNWADYY